MNTIFDKASKIKLLVSDVDGVFTNGQVYLTDHGEEKELRVFHVQDGLGIKLLLECGIEVAVISGRSSNILQQRMSELGVKHIYQNCNEKLPIFLQLLEQLNLRPEQAAYIGDDLPDLPLIRRAGLGFAVANAVPQVKQHASWHTQAPGGAGAVREVCDLLLQAQNRAQLILEQYL